MKRQPLPVPPPGWSNDELTAFIDDASTNTYATFHNLKSEYTKLSEIDAAFRKAVDHLSHTSDLLAAFFVVQAHSSFLGAVRLALSGQVSETYACLRLTIENALYGFYVSKNPDSGEVWLRRHKSTDARKKVRNEFKVGTLLDTLKAADPHEGSVAESLYNDTIDHGAHPNELALIQRLKIVEGEGKTEFRIAYLLRGDSPGSLLVLRKTAQGGVLALGVFGLVYPERFELIGLTDKIRLLKRGL